MNTEIIFHIQTGPYWDWRVALDLFLGGAGVGALLFCRTDRRNIQGQISAHLPYSGLLGSLPCFGRIASGHDKNGAALSSVPGLY